MNQTLRRCERVPMELFIDLDYAHDDDCGSVFSSFRIRSVPELRVKE